MSDEEYLKLLDRAFSQLPALTANKEDFVIPKADLFIQGNKTIVRNLFAIADTARRKPADIARYISKELSVPVDIEEQRLIINGRFQQDEIDSKLHKYFETYVICKECHKPDTHLESAERGLYLVCEACGARYWVKGY
ncbi:MAG: translation initiation factor IF-2 subunit beta [Candidatus Micrarchaeia archaeon]